MGVIFTAVGNYLVPVHRRPIIMTALFAFRAQKKSCKKTYIVVVRGVGGGGGV